VVAAIIVLLLLIVLFGGGGAVLGDVGHILWIILLIGIVLWVLGFFMRAAEGGGRWYRW
jgi:hypothetical protein